MPGSVRDLKTRLLEAIDQEGNVTNMEILCEVVTALETTQLTAEDLHVTRLGKFVNLARKKATDRSLSKRLKNLVKRWQKLLQNGLSNGLAPSADISLCAPTPPPTAPTITGPDGLMRISTPVSQASSPEVTLLQTPIVQQSLTPCPPAVPLQPAVSASPLHSGTSPPSVSTPAPPGPLGVPPGPLGAPPGPSGTPPGLSGAPPGPSGTKNDAIFNRRQKLQMLSQVNKRAPAISSFSSVSPNITHPVKSEATDIDQDRGATSIIMGTTPFIRGISAAFKGTTPSLADTHSDDTCTEPEGLIVRIPFVAVKKAFRKHPPTGANGSVSVAPSSPLPDHTHTIMTSSVEQVIQAVAPPSHDHTPNEVTTAFVEHTLSLVVSIDTSRFAPNVASDSTSVCLNEVAMRGSQENIGVPPGCVPGVDGHIGQDGCWYDWTKAMPQMDGTTVTILPYVYVDGWDVTEQ